MDTRNLKLIFVKPLGKNSMDFYEYDFYFSETPEIVWGDDWDVDFPNQIEDMLPDSTTYSHTERLKSMIPFFCCQNNSCFSMKHIVDGVLALAFEDISEYDEYPEPYRIVFQFGEKYDDVERKLSGRQQFFSEN